MAESFIMGISQISLEILAHEITNGITMMHLSRTISLVSWVLHAYLLVFSWNSWVLVGVSIFPYRDSLSVSLFRSNPNISGHKI